MSVGIFTQKKCQPSEAEVRQAIGAKMPLWDEMVRYVREKYPSDEEFKFMYGKKYGWALRFRIKGQLVTSLYPGHDGFSAQVNLSPKAVEEAMRLPLDEHALQAITNAYPYPEGRWVFVRVEKDGDVRDVQKLLALRAADKRF